MNNIITSTVGKNYMLFKTYPEPKPYIIQWGSISGLSSTNEHVNQTLTFLKPFNEVIGYVVFLISANSNNNYYQTCGVLSRTTTSCKWSSSYLHNRDAKSTEFMWIAVGVNAN